MTEPLKDKVVLMSGGSRGIGWRWTCSSRASEQPELE